MRLRGREGFKFFRIQQTQKNIKWIFAMKCKYYQLSITSDLMYCFPTKNLIKVQCEAESPTSGPQVIQGPQMCFIWLILCLKSFLKIGCIFLKITGLHIKIQIWGNPWFLFPLCNSLLQLTADLPQPLGHFSFSLSPPFIYVDSLHLNDKSR